MKARAALHALIAAALGVATLVVSCDTGASGPPPRTIRSVMYELDASKRQIEPNYRNSTMLPELAEQGRAILAVVDDPAFAKHPDTPYFRGDAALFREFHGELRTATEAFVAAAEAQQLDPLREAWIDMLITCTACHKRFDPTY